MTLDRLRYWTRSILGVAVLLCITIFGWVLGELGLTLIAFSWIAFPIVQLVWAVRRFHDAGLSGAWLLLNAVPFFGNVLVLILLLLPTETFDGYDKQPAGRL